ncbi:MULTISPECIES: ChaN family lipoprotein [Burkholderiales]|uniref:ChaN family lipoprotein n=1 Tax=Burkholderiales TaxID=80840 RepID=UPI001818ABAB|nr:MULTISPECIES: ChaN family lipoprotein [Burkholderiales]MBA2673957.1 ChaN family lipoprotein [Ramlibacter sp.]MBA3595844.1 ChaN family lipoprotein [Methylibium sp.]
MRAPPRAFAVPLSLALAAVACVAPPAPGGAAEPSVRVPASTAGPGALRAGWPAAEVLLIGEQHDAAEHQRLAAQVVERLATQGRLIAVVLEMAEQGRSTAALRHDADEARMRAALAWDERGWPWAAYGPIVMAAVRAGVPVIGANLARSSLREVMRDERLDTEVNDALRERLLTDVRDGHCGLLPASQLPGMTRVQIGRDRAMATALAAQAKSSGVVMLVAGANHVDKTRGVPEHLRAQAPGLRVHALGLAAGKPEGAAAAGFDEIWVTPALQRPDPCEGLAERFAPAR